MITLNYSITEQEYKDFYYFMGWLSPDRKKYRVKYFVRTFATFLALVILLFYIRDTRFNVAGLIIILLVMGGLYLYSVFRVKSHYHNFGKKVFQESGSTPIEVTISETGIFAKGHDGETHYKWSAFAKKFEANNCYYLLMSSQLGIIVPKRVFTLKDDREAFEKMLSENLPLRATLPKVD
jgi:hypothetical protein